MPIFMCEQCGCIENTAISNYWTRGDYRSERDGEQSGEVDDRALCSECDPETKKWHGRFDKTSAEGLVLADDGFLYDPADVASDSFKFRMKHQGLKVVGEYIACERCKAVGDEVIAGDVAVSCSGCGGTGLALKKA